MIYSEVLGEKISRLGLGCMRLPVRTDGSIDEEKTAEMVACAIENGVNYFDTAYPYHEGTSETVMGRILSRYPRESFYLADKFPGHQIMASYDCAEIFEEQLQKCQVDYFDFYLLHNVYAKSIQTYEDKKWGILDYFLEQKRNGRIRHLGFSTHATLEDLKAFVGRHPGELEFCQMQLNYLDWTLQDAREKYEFLTENNIPVWVMEPLRGGKLASFTPEQQARMDALRPGVKPAEWSFSFLRGLDNVALVLSGMNTCESMLENTKTFSSREPLTQAEIAALLETAEELKGAVPCTRCRYCVDGCPKKLDIPRLIALWNDFRYYKSFNITMAIEALPPEKRPDACIGCGRCARVCPQGIDIPGELKKFAAGLKEKPSWEKLCRERDEAARKARGK